FSDTVYGLGAGLFFAGYILFEVPSNLVLQRVGAKLWIARIMITWGLLPGSTMFVHTPMQFYIVRFLLGAAEAGFLPGVLLYLTQWYPDAHPPRIVALFMVGLPLSSMIGSPISGWIMRAFDGTHGLGGWQWLFLLEALPSVLLGFAVLRWLPNNIESAQWLTADEQHALRANLDADPSGNKSHALGKAFSDPKVWALGLIDLCVLLGLYAVSFWLPTLLRATGVKHASHIGWLMLLPPAAPVPAKLYCRARSDRPREPRWHLAVPIPVSPAATAISPPSHTAPFRTAPPVSLIHA
ncbi:MFS transporter, partial [Pseudomonas sp. MWU13-2625]